MKIAFCSSEVFPFAKTGGLGDVAGALPQALAKAGCEVKIFMPLYKSIKPEKTYGGFGTSALNGIEVVFVKNDDYFLRDSLYTTAEGKDYPDSLERFSFYSKQVLEILKKIGFKPDIIHNNDWQASTISIYLKTLYQDDSFFKNTKCILTIHNLAYQGLFEKSRFDALGISKDYFDMHYLEFWGKVNLLKGGIIFSDKITTVSPAYAKQVQTPEYGCGLEGVLQEKKESLYGILNAIDYNIWDPKIDKAIYKQYDPLTIENKAINKAGLQEELGLKKDKNVLLLGMVTRLAEQKGIDIFSKALDEMLKKYQLVVLGQGEPKYHKILQEKQAKFRDSFSLQLSFNEVLAHKIYAASDIFLMPSRFEPCGLSQMISYKYATIPLVHYTGGLIDTVKDVSQGGGGFVFNNYKSEDLISAIERADSLFQNKDKWRELIKKVTNYNFSWETAAKEYIKLYEKLINYK
ncbi:MAG: glycogen synthase GlgA [Candidatus Omnitrophota bacterium]